MSKLVDQIFSDEPRKRKKLLKSQKKAAKRDEIPNLQLTKVEEAIEFDENENGKKCKPKKQRKVVSRRSCCDIRKTNTISCEDCSEKYTTKNIKQKKKFINKTGLFNKKKLQKKLQKALNESDDDINSNENDSSVDISDSDSESESNSDNNRKYNENHFYPSCKGKKKKYVKSDIDSRTVLKNQSSDKITKRFAKKKYNSPKKTQKSVMPFTSTKKKISFAFEQKKNKSNDEDDYNSEDQDNNGVPVKKKNKLKKKHRTIRMPRKMTDTQNYNDNLNDISNNNSEESKESVAVKKRNRKKTSTLKSKKAKQKNNDKDGTEIIEHNYHVDKFNKKNNMCNNLKVIKENNNHGSNRNSNRNNKFIKKANNSIEEYHCEESQESNPQYSYSGEDNESNMVSNGISKRKKIMDLKINNNEDEKSITDSNEGGLKIKKIAKEGLNNKSYKKMKRSYNESNSIKNNNIALFKISKLVNNIHIKNDYERRVFEIPQKFKVVKPEALISLEYNDKFLLQKDNTIQNYSKVSMRNIEKNDNNNIIITRKESQKKINSNESEEIKKYEDSKDENEEKIKNNKKNKKGKKSAFCCL